MPATKTPKLNVRLLRRIQKHILEEPRRFYMGWWYESGSPFEGERYAPPCGTTACIVAAKSPLRMAKAGAARIEHFIKTKGAE